LLTRHMKLAKDKVFFKIRLAAFRSAAALTPDTQYLRIGQNLE